MNYLLSAINKIAFSIGDIDIAWYGIIVTTGIVAAFLLFLYMAKKQGLDDDFSLEAFIWVIILAVIFCRVFYVVPRWGEDYTTLKEAINIREGGLTIVGGIFGGVLAIIICTFKNRKYHLARLSDACAFPVMIGQVIGRWGNFVNQELFGLQILNPTFQHFPFAVYIENPAIYYAGYKAGWYCALFFYESVINLIGLIVGLILYHKFKDKIKPMTLTLGYLTWYGLVRGSLEFLKIDHVTLGNTGIGTIQIICYTVACIGIILLVLLYTNKINFESKKFQTVIDARWIKIREKEALNEAKKNNSEKVDEVVEATEDTTSNLDESKGEVDELSTKDDEKPNATN